MAILARVNGIIKFSVVVVAAAFLHLVFILFAAIFCGLV